MQYNFPCTCAFGITCHSGEGFVFLFWLSVFTLSPVPVLSFVFIPTPFSVHHRNYNNNIHQLSEACTNASPLLHRLQLSSLKQQEPSSPSKASACKRENKSKSSNGKHFSKNKRKKRVILQAQGGQKHSESSPETWRLYGIEVHPDELQWDPKTEQRHQQRKTNNDDDNHDNDKPFLTPAVLQALDQKYPKLSGNILSVQVVRRSFDGRRRWPRSDGKAKGPRFTFVLDVTLPPGQSRSRGSGVLKHVPGKQELLGSCGISEDEDEAQLELNRGDHSHSQKDETKNKKHRVVIVGAGPAGLFCALELLSRGNNMEVTILERGQPVERRGQDIGALMHRRHLTPDSNFCFGEGGAGTWSDGKLTTRIGRNSQAVRQVLSTLVEHGAPSIIQVHGTPHLGTDNLVRLLRNLRLALQEKGATILFGTQMKRLILQDDTIRDNNNDNIISSLPKKAVGVEYSLVGAADGVDKYTLYADSVVLATGHSARDTYLALAEQKVPLEPKGFAVGFRIEHPQHLINQLQLGNEWGPSVETGKSTTDTINLEAFQGVRPHESNLPVPSYRLATDQARDGEWEQRRGVYSFCMCPGGQIVPTSTDPDQLCVNGMSFSRRDSLWANSALVVTVAPDDPILKPYVEEHGALAGVAFQQDMERRAAQMGGGNLTVPVQRVTDFIKGRQSDTIPASSYRLGVKSAPCHEIYPPPLTAALRDALVNHFEAVQMPGYVCDEGLMHGVETRTSSPVRIPRDGESLQAKGIQGLYPTGEGAGFAGGIVSAAVDGLHVADAICDNAMIIPGGDSARRSQKQKQRAQSSGGAFY